MNRVVLIGRLVRDPELRYAPNTGSPVASVKLAIDRRMPNRDGQKEADFIPVVIWGKQAEATANYMSKGRLLGVSGRIQTRNYEAKDGTRRYVIEVVAEEVQFLDYSKKVNAEDNYGSDNFDEDVTPVDDGDIPF